MRVNGASTREGTETARSRTQVRRGAASFRGTPHNASLGKKSESIIGSAYAWFLELPVPIVLMTVWLAGVVLICSLVGLLYLFWVLLLTVAAG